MKDIKTVHNDYYANKKISAEELTRLNEQYSLADLAAVLGNANKYGNQIWREYVIGLIAEKLISVSRGKTVVV